MGRADGTMYAVFVDPWVETHGYNIFRADGPINTGYKNDSTSKLEFAII